MGGCLCKRKVRQRSQSLNSETILNHNTHDLLRNARRPNRRRFLSDFLHEGNDRMVVSVTNDIKELIKQTLVLIRFIVSNDQEPPTPLLKLNLIADKEGGWILVVICMIETVPIDDPLGPAVITLFLDECPLPSKDSISRLVNNHMRLDCKKSAPPSWHRNACIVLGCLAENLTGPGSAHICTNATLNYIIENLNPKQDARVILFALIALEKLAQTSENRLAICRLLGQRSIHPFLELELWLNEPRFEVNWLRQQIGFCAQWLLDNTFPCHDREPSYLSTDTSGINAMLNHEDVSEYLKIGTNGLEARCDASSFESVRCTFEAVDGVWFYEALILTAGVMQIGFATKQSRFCNHEGYGIGDDEYSLAYDGCRQLLWHNAQFEKHEHKPWNAGDYLGCLLDIPGCFVQFYLNGQPLQNPHRKFMERRMTNFDSGIFAAASFMSFQQCRFNFGHHPFRYPPLNIEFKTFNEYGVLTEEQKTILPRRAKMELISNMIISDENCHICYTDSMDTVLEPCGHGAICFHCSNQIRQCPLCRVDISGRVRIAKKQSVISLERSFTYLMGMNSNEPISTMV